MTSGEATDGSGAWWTTIGELVDRYEIPLINPLMPSAPAWPGEHPQILLLRNRARPTSVVIIDRLRPADLPQGREFFMETHEQSSRISGHWPASLILELAAVVAGSLVE